MTADEKTQTLAAIDKAYGEQVAKLFGVLCSAGEREPDAAKLFKRGLERAVSRRRDAIAAASA